MADRWYVVPAEYALRETGSNGPATEETNPMVYRRPNAGNVWPEARSLPRRLRVSKKK